MSLGFRADKKNRNEALKENPYEIASHGGAIITGIRQ
jgi:hypothetical protein